MKKWFISAMLLLCCQGVFSRGIPPRYPVVLVEFKDVRFQLEEKRPHLGDSVAKHEAVVQALEAHDFIGFVKAMEYHFSSGKYRNPGSYEEEVQ